MDESLGARTKRIIKNAGISPRILSAVTKLHFTTIYAIMREEGTASNPITVDALSKNLDKIESLVLDGTLPFDRSTSHDQRGEILVKLLENAS